MLTEQEQFWKGEFGDQYVGRHKELDWRARAPFWRSIIEMTKARSILEVGCNIGGNLKAIRDVAPMIAAWGCDINQTALQEAADAGLSVVEVSVFDLKRVWLRERFDLVVTVGVLIHVAPADLYDAIDSIISASSRYVLAV